jgi:phytoene desaturase
MIPNQQRKRAAVIGAGPGGLAAAMLLSGQGYEVDVYEKQPVIGGRSSRLELGDYRFDRGATFLMMPQLIEEMFDIVGRKLSDYVEMKELTPLYALNFGDKVFTPSRNREDTAAQIKELFPGNEDNYLRFMQEEEVKFAKRCHDSSAETGHQQYGLWHPVPLFYRRASALGIYVPIQIPGHVCLGLSGYVYDSIVH